MSICLAGIFRDCVIVAADTLTTAQDEGKRAVAEELSHKIEPILGKYAIMFAGPKYLLTGVGGDAYSVNLIIRDAAKQLQGGLTAKRVFELIAGTLEQACRLTFGKCPQLPMFQSFFLGYDKGTPFYWAFDYDCEKGAVTEYFENRERHALVWCAGSETFKSPQRTSSYYSKLSLKSGKKFIRELLKQTYLDGLAKGPSPGINDRFDIGIICLNYFTWDNYEKFRETHFLSEAIAGKTGSAD